MTVNSSISDLFFNTDISEAEIRERGAFQGWDDEKFLYEAECFLGSLDRLGVPNLPTPEELVQDYKDRV